MRLSKKLPRKDTGREQVHLALPPETMRKLRLLANDTRRSLSEVVSIMIEATYATHFAEESDGES